MGSDQHVAILGQGYAVPDIIRGNDAPIFDWLKKHSPSGSDLFNGLKYRRVLPTADGVIDIMTTACEHALHQARVKPEHVDMIIGADYLAHRRIWLSYARKLVFIDRPAGP